jgi:scyllo-inositol 2-dehydrogenase (NADP+)
MARRIRVGVVGYGYAGRNFHVCLVDRVPDLELVAIVARSPERRELAEKDHGQRGVAVFGTLEDLLAGDHVDLVILATPHATHAPLSVLAMDAGKHVVTDKAMCLNTDEADAMIAASRRNNVVLSVFQNRRWDWDYLTVKKVLDEGLLGEPYLFEAAAMSYRAPRGWRGEVARSGGILFDWGAHLIDQALQLVPARVRSVTADVQRRGWGSEIGSYARVLLRFENDVLYDIEIGNLCRATKPRWFVLGERGGLVKTGDPRGEQEPALVAGNIDAATEDPAHRAQVWYDIDAQTASTEIEPVRGDWTNYYRNIADALNGRAELLVKPEQVRRVVAIFDAALGSNATGAATRVDV